MKDIKDFETLMGYLKGCNKSNATLKVKGSLRFDRYDGDVVMMADSIYKVKLHQREDLAECRASLSYRNEYNGRCFHCY